MRGYQQRSYGGDVAFFEARETHGQRPSAGWQAWITGRLTVITVPGDHQSMFREPAINTLSEELRRVLRSSDGS